MKLIATADALRPALESCAELADKTGKRPVYASTRLDADGSSVLISATNGSESVVLRVSEGIDPTSSGSVFLPSINLLRIVKDADKGPIEITWHEKETGAYLTYGSTRMRLPTEPPDNLPTIARFNDKKPFVRIESSALTALFKRTTLAVQTDFTHRALHGVCVRTLGPQATLASTDGRRFALLKRTIENPNMAAIDLLVPPPGAKRLARLAKTGEQIDLQETRGKLMIRGPGGELTFRTIAGDFPDYEGHIPLTSARTMSVNRKALIATLSRHEVIQGTTAAKHKLLFTNGNMEMKSSCGVDGEVSVRLAVPWTWGSFTIYLDPRLVIDGLSAMESEEITVGIDDEVSPVVLREQTAAHDYRYMVVPMSQR